MARNFYPVDLATAGFYYAVLDDVFICFHSGIEVLEWLSTDILIQEHLHPPNVTMLKW